MYKINKIKYFFKTKIKNHKNLQAKWSYYIYCQIRKIRWLKFKLFTVLYDIDKFKRKRIKIGRYPTKPWMKGAEYLKYRNRYHNKLINKSARFSQHINKSLNLTSTYIKRTDLSTKQIFLDFTDVLNFLKKQ